MSNAPAVAASDLSFRIGTATILGSVNLTLPGGSVTAVIGPNGAGKSTLLRCVALVSKPAAGRIAILGTQYQFPMRDPVSPTPWPVLTMTFQSPHLWPHLSIRENIALAVRSRRANWRADVEERIGQLALADLAGRFPSEVSGGERQRTAVARALALNPQVLLLDEPTSASDVEHALALASLLRHEAQRGAAILLATHYIGFARLVADYIIFLDLGRVEDHGDVAILDAPSSPRMKRFLSVA